MGWKEAALAEIARDTDGLSKAWLFAQAGERDAALRQLEQLPAKEREYLVLRAASAPALGSTS